MCSKRQRSTIYWECSSPVGTALDRRASDAGSIPRAAREFSPRVNVQWRLSYGVCTPPCAIACVNICVHVRDPVFHARVRWIMETLKDPARTVGWVARFCRNWLSPGKASRISYGRNPNWTIQLFKKKKAQNRASVSEWSISIGTVWKATDSGAHTDFPERIDCKKLNRTDEVYVRRSLTLPTDI